jgi:erythromycin esterase-like protein
MRPRHSCAHRATLSDAAPTRQTATARRSPEGRTSVGLGEATHGTHEDFAFKAALIKALVTAGRINAVAFETNYHGGRRLDAFIRGGPGTAADALRDSRMSQFWITQEIADLLDWLRAWNARAKSRSALSASMCRTFCAIPMPPSAFSPRSNRPPSNCCARAGNRC